MARQRNYAAEEARRNELAQERGFANRAEEREFRRETKHERAVAAEALGVRPNVGNPRALASYYENVLVPIATAESPEATGEMKHLAVRAYVDMGYSQEEAIELMRELYGTTPGGEQ